jgi:hypothetical protein
LIVQPERAVPQEPRQEWIMRNRLGPLARVLAAVLVLGACYDAEAPTQPGGPRLMPSFSTASDDGGDGLPEATEPAQEINMPSGSDFLCAGIFTGVFDDVLVLPNTMCWLINATVHGNVKALANAALIVQQSQVRGNVVGDRADAVLLTNDQIGGSIHIAQGGVGAFAIFEVLVCDTHLPNGNIHVEKMRGSVALGLAPARPDVIAFCGGGPQGNQIDKGNIRAEDNIILAGRRLDIRQNVIGQNLQVFKNIGPGEKFVQNNAAGENVQCTENTPPFVGSPNVASTNEDQCAP